jgi:hypothetical protein
MKEKMGHYVVGLLGIYYLFKRRFKMQEDIKLGSFGDLVIGFSGGKVSLTATANVDGKAIAIGATVTADAGVFIDQLEAIVAKAIPASAPFDPAIFAVIKTAVLSIQ